MGIENPRVRGSIPRLATNILKTNPYRLVFFRLYPPVPRIPDMTSRACASCIAAGLVADDQEGKQPRRGRFSKFFQERQAGAGSSGSGV